MGTRLLWAAGGVAGLLALRAATRGGIVAGGRAPARSGFGVKRGHRHHRGIDIYAPAGSDVYAAGRGTVAARWRDGAVRGYGNTVVLQHPDGFQTLYGHLETFAPGLEVGDRVRRGELIGTVGQTQAPKPPMEDPPHVHLEVHTAHDLKLRGDNPRRIDPHRYLALNNMGVSA